MIDALAETEVIGRSVAANEKEAAALPLRMIANVECFDPSANLLLWLCMSPLDETGED